MDPSCHRLGLLVPIEHHLNATANLSIVADAHPFMSSVSSSEGFFQQDNAQSSNHLK